MLHRLIVIAMWVWSGIMFIAMGGACNSAPHDTAGAAGATLAVGFLFWIWLVPMIVLGFFALVTKPRR